MLVNPINNTSNNINFKSQIKPTEDLRQGFLMIQRSVESETIKNLNATKDFLDSLVRIRESKKNTSFKIEIDKRRENHSYIRINGRRTSGGHNEWNSNINDDYLVVEGLKKYAAKLEDIEPSRLDLLKNEIIEAENKLWELKERYANQLKAELEQAQKSIFGDTK